MPTKSATLKASCGSKASKHGSKPAEPKDSAEGLIEVVPQGEVPGQVTVAAPKVPVWEFDLGNGKKFSWKVDETCKVKPSSKDCRHVLQANGGIIANCYGRKALSLPKHTILEIALSVFSKIRSLKRFCAYGWTNIGIGQVFQEYLP